MQIISTKPITYTISFIKMDIFFKFQPFHKISIFSNGSHHGWRSGLSDTILTGDHPRTIPAYFEFNWPRGVMVKDFQIKF